MFQIAKACEMAPFNAENALPSIHKIAFHVVLLSYS